MGTGRGSFWAFALLAGGVLFGQAGDLAALVGGSTARTDSITGKWVGETGFADDRVAIGFEFQATSEGIKAFWYAPVTNFYALPLDGFLERSEDGSYRHASVAMTLRLEGDSLVGTYYPFNAPITMRRTEVLPSDPPLPDLPAGPGPVWITKLGGSIYAPVAFRDGMAYVGTTAGLLFAVDVADGTPKWAFTAGRPIHGGALATEDAVFFVCDNGFLYRLDRESGEEVWRYDLGDAQTVRVLAHAVEESFDLDTTAPTPLLVEGVLFVGAGNGSFHAVDAESGERVWRVDIGGKVRTTALALGRNVVFGGWDGTLQAVDRASGAVAWSREVPGEITSEPALIDGMLILGTRSGLLVALDPETRRPVWRKLFWGSSVESHPVGYDAAIYIGSSNLRRVAAYSPTDGAVLWRTDVYGMAWGRPLVTDDVIIQGAVGFAPHPIRHLGSVVALDRRTGGILWRWPAPPCGGCLTEGFAAGATLAGDRVLVGGLDGSLYAFERPEPPQRP